MIVVGHGIGGVRDLPVPEWLFLWGAALVLLLSFVALGSLWPRPLLARHRLGRPLAAGLSRIVLARALRVAVQAVSTALFLLVVAAALVGTSDPYANLAPTWVYVVFWLGLPALSVVLGDVWRVLSPWRALADGFVWAWTRGGRVAEPLAAYPERLGRWPAAVALFAFASLELAYADAADPRSLALAIALYTYVTLFGFVAFGRETWSGRGEGFAVLFGLFARMAPLTVAKGRLHARWPLAGLAGRDATPGTVAFVAVMLGSVAFDGLSRTSWWQNLLADVEGPYVLGRPWLAELLTTGVNVLGILVLCIVAAGAYRLACAAARSMVRAPRPLEPEFVLSLVPIAFAYEVAHYFSLALVQGQFTAPLLSDPLGRGWDLLGTSNVEPNLAPLSPNTVWYVQAGALVAGHVAGLVVAHDRAVSVFEDPRAALRSQYAMLALMILYTVGGLWILSRG